MISKLSIVIPAYNEEKTISNILDKVIKVNLIAGIKKELIIVDDCSKDATLQVLQEYCKSHSELDIKVLHHEVNQGKGAALHTGIKHATGKIYRSDEKEISLKSNDGLGLLAEVSVFFLLKKLL